MNILFVTFGELSIESGAHHTLSILRALADAGHDIDVIAGAVRIAPHPNVHVLAAPSDRMLSRRFLRRMFKKAARKKAYQLIHVVDEAVLCLAHGMWWRRVAVVYEASRCFTGSNGTAPSWKWKLAPTHYAHIEKKALKRTDLVLTFCDLLTVDLQRLQKNARIIQLESVPAQTLLPRGETDESTLLSRFGCGVARIGVCCIRPGNRQDIRKLLMAVRKVTDTLPDAGFFFTGLPVEEAESMARNLDIREQCVFLEDHETADYFGALDIADAVLFVPRPGDRYADPEVFTVLNSSSALVAVQETAYSGVLDERNSIQVVPTVDSIAEGILRVFQEPLLALAIAVEGQQQIANRHSFSSFKHQIRMAYHDLQEP
jgi:glycosyltransferase involved in cell wall biosynthesis